MTTTDTVREHNGTFLNSIVQGDCIQVMRQLSAQSVDLILTDPPYLVNFRDHAGRSIANDRDDMRDHGKSE